MQLAIFNSRLSYYFYSILAKRPCIAAFAFFLPYTQMIVMNVSCNNVYFYLDPFIFKKLFLTTLNVRTAFIAKDQ
jgi:hypothetical protein